MIFSCELCLMIFSLLFNKSQIIGKDSLLREIVHLCLGRNSRKCIEKRNQKRRYDIQS